MTNEQQIIHIIQTTPTLMTILHLIQDCHLKQGALAAGSIRNTVWQVLSGQPVQLGSDIDVVFFDPERPASDDLQIYQHLTSKAPEYQWQVKNEVYMAHYNFADNPEFTSVTDAIGHFVETPTCIGAFLDGDCVQLIAPHGVDDLVNFHCRPIPYYCQDTKHLAIYQQRMAQKQWQHQWPQLKIIDF
ncbi:nucleotidyltransferase family protein [Lactiplantibacillus paraplantarum]|uniref:Nucleotidyltransferase family protein n=1 Tax=Lactiplantibacillus paraplantarum TaxID=60520 RepID=A0A4Q9Y3Z4_9LACO|nr:nucleotidyltransferase family protein [Lactiplantibacillus paraplantarum]